MATTETSEREYSPKAAGAAKGSFGPASAGVGLAPRFPTPPNRTHPDAPTRDLTGPHGTWEPTQRDLRTPDIPQSPTYRGHTTRIPPDTPGVRRSHDASDTGSRVVATTNGPRHRPPLRHQLGVHVRRAVGD